MLTKAAFCDTILKSKLRKKNFNKSKVQRNSTYLKRIFVTLLNVFTH